MNGATQELPITHRRCQRWQGALLLGLLGIGAMLAPTHASTAAKAHGTRTFQVDIRNFMFAPNKLIVPAGARVVWTNRDEEPHIVVSTGGGFTASSAMDTGDSYGTTFAKSGTYTYFCSIHPMMVGTIIVK